MPQLERIFSEVSQLREHASRIRSHHDTEILVSSIPALAGTLLAKAIRSFRRSNPRTVVRVMSFTAAQVISAVEAGEADIGLVHGPITGANLIRTPFDQSEIVAVMQRDHPLARLQRVSAQELSVYEVISLGTQNLPGEITSRAFQRANLPFPSVVELTSAASAIVFAKETLGVALVDSRSASTFSFDDTITLPFTPRLSMVAEAITFAGRQISLEALALIRALEAVGTLGSGPH